MKLVQAFFAIALILYLFSAECEGNIKPRNPMKAMTGEHLRIVAYHEPPIFSIIRSPANESVVRYVGFPKEVFDLLSSALNFTYSFVEVTPSMVKRIGSIDAAMIDQLVQKNADINGRLITPTAERLAYMDFTTAVSVFTFAMIQPMPRIHNRFLAPIKPFQPTVWYLIFIAFAATALILTAIQRRSAGPAVGGRMLTDNAWYALVVLMSQGGHMRSSRLPMRLAAGSWCLIAFVLVYAYNSTLVSYISLSKYESVVNTWHDLAASTNLRVTVPRGSISADIILVRTNYFILKNVGLFLPLTLWGLDLKKKKKKECKDGSGENVGRFAEAQSRRSFVDLAWRTGQSFAFRLLRSRRSEKIGRGARVQEHAGTSGRVPFNSRQGTRLLASVELRRGQTPGPPVKH